MRSSVCLYADSRLYCGFENAIEVFDVLNPGEGERIKTTFTRRERGGQKGEGAEGLVC